MIYISIEFIELSYFKYNSLIILSFILKMEKIKNQKQNDYNYLEILKKKFGFEKLKPFQEKMMKYLDGDLLILSPTGSGKSLCFQLPAIMDNGITVVISPLKSLIEDQIIQLKQKKINVDFINGDISKKDRTELYKKLKTTTEYLLLYVTPEIITTDDKLISILKELQKTNKFARLVIDEAHCVSTWGHDFRISYLHLGSVKKLFPSVKIMALTATATPKVKEDIIKILEMNNPHIEISSFFRPNLLLKIINRNDTNLSHLRDMIVNNYKEQTGIIYCHSRRETERIASYLDNFMTAKNYHAGLHQNIRKLIQKQWLAGQVKIIVATIAFGMGIDKPNVRFVIHYNLPSSLEGYYQEIGRAGRDDNPSDCILYYSYHDKIFYDRLIRQNNPQKSNNSFNNDFSVGLSNIDNVEFINTDIEENDINKSSEKSSEEECEKQINLKIIEEQIKEQTKEQTKEQIKEQTLLKKEEDHLNYQLNKLNEMVNFVENVIDCRHYQLSTYFGEKTIEKSDWCNGFCDNCIRHKDQSNLCEKDLTENALKIIEIITNLKKNNEKDNANKIITRKILNINYQKQIGSLLPATHLTIDRLIGRMIGMNLLKENLVQSESSLWFEDINLTDETDENKEFCVKMLIPDSKSMITSYLINEMEKKGLDKGLKEVNEKPKKKTSPKNKSNKLENGFDFKEEYGKKAFSQELMDDELQEAYNLTHLPLYNNLMQYRTSEAKRLKVAPYRIFTNQSLEEIVKFKPINENLLKNIHGIGDAKIREFGKDIIKIIKETL